MVEQLVISTLGPVHPVSASWLKSSAFRTPTIMATSELACVYATLILHDDGVDITVSIILQ